MLSKSVEKHEDAFQSVEKHENFITKKRKKKKRMPNSYTIKLLLYLQRKRIFEATKLFF